MTPDSLLADLAVAALFGACLLALIAIHFQVELTTIRRELRNLRRELRNLRREPSNPATSAGLRHRASERPPTSRGGTKS